MQFLLDAGNIVFGGPGDDELWGGEGDDHLESEDGNDIFHGGAGADRIFGGEGVDRLIGGEGDDELHGEGGDDLLSGEEGSDRLFGEQGDDTLYGGGGLDSIEDGEGANRTFADEDPAFELPTAAFAQVAPRVKWQQPLLLDGRGSHAGAEDLGIVAHEWDLDYDGLAFDVDATGAMTTARLTDSGRRLIALRVRDDQTPAFSDIVVREVFVGLPGDVDLDGVVSLTDFGLLKENFGKVASAGDVTGDGRVDLSDFGILKENFGRSVSLNPGDENGLATAAVDRVLQTYLPWERPPYGGSKGAALLALAQSLSRQVTGTAGRDRGGPQAH